MHAAREQLWHIDGEHLFTSEEDFRLSGEQGRRIRKRFTQELETNLRVAMFEVLQ